MSLTRLGFVVKKDSSLLSVRARIQENPMSYVVIVDDDDRLLGTISGSDLDRAEKSGSAVDIDGILAMKWGTPYAKPFSVRRETPAFEIYQIMCTFGLLFMPVVDRHGRVVDVLSEGEARASLTAAMIDRAKRELFRPPMDSLLDRMDAVLGPKMGGGLPQVVLPLMMRTTRIGHLVLELSLLKTIFDVDKHDIIILIPSVMPADLNWDVFAMATRGCRVIRTDDVEVFRYEWRNLGVHRRDDRTYIVDFCFLYQAAHQLMRRGIPRALFSFSAAERGQADELLRSLGIGSGQPVVTVHIREPGFYGGSIRSKQSFRDCRVEDYLPAIRYLVDSGHTVVRLGDPTMTRLPDMGPRLIDWPFQRSALGLSGFGIWDAALIERSRFMLHTSSGPQAFACVFQVPAIMTNSNHHARYMPGIGHIDCFRPLYSRALGRLMSAREVYSSDVMNFLESSEYEAAGIDLIGMTSDQILRAVREMVARTTGGWTDDDEFNGLFAAAAEACHQRRVGDPALIESHLNFFGMALPHARLSMDFALETGFLTRS